MTSVDTHDRASADRSDRQAVARRLLDSSEQLSYDPVQEVDWETPLDTDHHGTSPEWSTLYGTSYWDEMTPEQQRELTRQEAASVASTGIWFEMILQQMVLRDFYAKDPTDPAFQWALTEIADECRHSTMFARMVERIGCPPYGPRRHAYQLGKLLPVIGSGPALYGSILVAEEVLDRLQRETMADEGVQPLVRMVNRIHVLEEARHVRFAREEVVRGMADLSRRELPYQRWLIANTSMFVTRSLIHPDVYAAVGLDR
ncbi:diiron oxygenase, partial [Saccharothrix sp. MB29]|nr:diiron oxygenase [Saccharothrix sp. MB29]